MEVLTNADRSIKKQRCDGFAAKLESGPSQAGAGPQSSRPELDIWPAAAEAPPVSRGAGSGLNPKALEPLLGPWQELDTGLAPFASNISTFDSAMAASSKQGGNGVAGARLEQGHTPKPCAEDASASSSHVRMRLHALLDNL